MRKLTRKNWIELAAMTVIFVIAAVLVYRTTILTRMVLPRMNTEVKAEKGCEYKLSDGDRIEQSFVYSSDELLSAGMVVSVNDDAIGDLVSNQKDTDLGKIHMRVLDETKTEIMRADYDVYMLADGQNMIASLAGMQTGFEGKELTIIVDAEQIREEAEVAIGFREEKAKDTRLFLNGEEKAMTFNICTANHQFMYWKKWSVFGAGLIYLMLIGIYVLLGVYRVKTEKVFLFTGSILAVLYLLLLPPLSVPDEEAHFKMAYRYSTQILGKEESQKENTIFMDTEDFHAMQMFQTTPSLSEYDTLKDEITKSGREEGVQEIKCVDTQAPSATYLPGIIGISIGRLLGLNGILVIVLGRICSILFYLFTMYWFIKLMPFGKAAAFIIAILPMTIQQCGSYSYDSVVIEVAFLYLAVLFSLLYEDKKIEKRQIILYIICMIMLSVSKGGTYMPLCLLTMMIPVSRFKNKKQKWIFVGSMAAIAIVSFLGSTLSYVLYVAAPTAEQAADAYLEGEAYGAAGLLSEPMTFIGLSVRTLFLSGDGFLETMLGMQLGWLNVFVSRIVIYGMLLLTVLAVLPTEEKSAENIEVYTWHRVCYVIVGAMSAFMVFASMFMSWTPKNSTAISGIQGRYFLPLLPSFLLVLRSRNLVRKKQKSERLIFLAVCLQCVAIYGILMSLERVL